MLIPWLLLGYTGMVSKRKESCLYSLKKCSQIKLYKMHKFVSALNNLLFLCHFIIPKAVF